jgi:hypothetical protein
MLTLMVMVMLALMVMVMVLMQCLWVECQQKQQTQQPTRC